jgi:hypothetical protein
MYGNTQNGSDASAEIFRLVIPSFPLPFRVKGNGDQEIDRLVRRMRFQGPPYLPPELIGQFLIPMIFKGMNEMLHFASFFIMEKSGGIRDGSFTCEKPPDWILSLIEKVGMRQAAKALQANLFLVLYQRLFAQYAQPGEKEVE